MQDNHPKRVENYTGAFLASAFVNLLWMLAVIWALVGFWAVVATTILLDYLISRVRIARARREIPYPARSDR